jgi:hypothetical protein
VTLPNFDSLSGSGTGVIDFGIRSGEKHSTE